MMLHAKYQVSRFCGFRQEDLLKFPSAKSILACVTKICNGPEPIEQLLKMSNVSQ